MSDVLQGVPESEISKEQEYTELKSKATRLLREAFSGILEPEELETRLSAIEKTRFVSAEEYEAMVQEHPEDRDAAGLLRVEHRDGQNHRYAIVRIDQPSAETMHTFLHESTHLMAPNGGRVYGRVTDDQETYSVYIGALKTRRFVETGKVDTDSLPLKNALGQVRFWEGVTDWHADELLVSELTQTERESLETTGYIERQYIGYLVDHAPDRPRLVTAIREAYATGNEDPFRWALHEMTGRTDDVFYDEMLKVMEMKPQDWEARVDAWMAVVNKHFPQ